MPNVKPVPPQGTPTKITVKEGESLGVLAQRYNTSVNSIMKANGLKNDNIMSGQTLTIYVVSDEDMRHYNDLKKAYELQVLEEQHKKEVTERTDKAEAKIQKAINDGFSQYYDFSINEEGHIVIRLKSERQLGDISSDFNLKPGSLLKTNPSIKDRHEMGKGIRKSDGEKYDTWDATFGNVDEIFVIDTDECKTKKSLSKLFEPARDAAKKGRLW